VGIPAVVLLTRDDGPAVVQAESVVTSTTSVATTTTEPATSTSPPTTANPVVVGQLPDGLFCKDLHAAGYSYSAAVDYWKLHLQTNRMDADQNGIPCETVYPSTEVRAYWGQGATARDVDSARSAVASLPLGLRCKDLKEQGYSVHDAIEYYLAWGEPELMDADHNGIPCETVYSGALEAWTNR
jgi:hypothetical protein